ncbi:MAG: fructose-bisphosphatase class II family protein [Candidatus Krumholzibacteria bacterium]|nr:fructose-bisphosphatase class II family protein [Candidatus Krumholzibacteria bacterium]
MDRNLALELVRVTEAAALASARYFGKGNPVAADQAAVSAMELAMRGVKINGRIIIGEEKIADVSRLCSGDGVGAEGELEVDVVLDCLECAGALANGQPNAISAIAIGEKDSFKKLREPYMRKIAVGPEAADRIDLTASTFDNLVRIAEAKRTYVENLTVSILDRERHRRLIDEVREAGARIELIRDGDLAASIAAALPGTGIDVMMGIGGTKQGLISAAALSCIRGGFQAQVFPGESFDLDKLPPDYEKIYTIQDLIGTFNIMFAATGVSHSDFLDGVIFRPSGAVTNSVVFRGRSGTVRFLKTEHFFDKIPDYT